MASRLVPYYVQVTEYDQAGEDALAVTLAGKSAYSVFIFNTTVGKTRVWNGSIFVSASSATPDGGTWPTTFTPAAHNHDAAYASLNHNHDASYSAANHTHQSLVCNGAITSSGGGIGYATGAGGTVSQGTNRTTGVTLNKLCGNITMFSAAQASQALVTFTLTNSFIAATDFVLVQHISATNGGAWNISVVAGNGSCTISVRNVSSGSITEATPLKFVIIKSVTA